MDMLDIFLLIVIVMTGLQFQHLNKNNIRHDERPYGVICMVLIAFLFIKVCFPHEDWEKLCDLIFFNED
jgi:hypothetical protein